MALSIGGKSIESWGGTQLALALLSSLVVFSLPPNALAFAFDFSNGWWTALQTFEPWDGRVYFALAIVLTVLLLTLHPTSLIRRLLYYVPIVLLCAAYRAPLGDKAATAASTGAYQYGILLAGWTMRILDRLYLNRPEEAFRYKGEETISPLTYTPLQKLGWAVELMIVTRGVGWNWEIRQIPKMPQLSRRGFLLWKARSALLTICMLYIIRLAANSLTRLSEDNIAKGESRVASLLLHPVSLHAFMYASWAFVVYSSLNLAENLFALFFVGFRVTKRWGQQEMWPPVFGDVRDSYSIRRGWGIFWHQNMRRVCASPGNFVVQMIPSLRSPQTKLSQLTRRYLRLILIFVFSGIIHAGGSIYMTQRQTTVHDGGNIIGFIYQGLSLIAEDTVLSWMNIDDSLPQSLTRRVIGFTLVHGYAAYATPTLKVIPLARDHGLDVAANGLLAGVQMVGMGAQGVLKNPFATMVGSFNV